MLHLHDICRLFISNLDKNEKQKEKKIRKKNHTNINILV